MAGEPSDKKRQEAYQRGMDAYKDHRSIEDNNYPPESPLWHTWREGWLEEENLPNKD